MADLRPATDALTAVVDGIRDDQLTEPTPCPGSTVADLIDHVDGFTLAFAAAARKQPLEGAPRADGSRLGPDWRPRIRQRLADLATAWDDPQAWTGMTRAGGQDLPGEVAGAVAVDEVLVHGWDLAVASGQPFTGDPATVELALTFVAPTVAANPDGVPGLFGPRLPVPDDAPALHQLLALTGRNPGWTAPGR